jgi:hypothetical protein
MDIKTKLLENEMTRKEFLIYMSMALVSVLGLKNFLSLLNGSFHREYMAKPQSSQDKANGFGSRKFGE